MKSLVSFLSRAVLRAPVWVIIVVVAITFVLGGFIPQQVVADGNEGFAPDAPALEASNRIGEFFGDESSGSVLQIIVSAEDGDILDAEGLETVQLLTDAVEGSALVDRLQNQPGRGSVISFFAPAQGQPGSVSVTIASDDGDVFTPEGAALSQAVQAAIANSSVGSKLATEGDQPPIVSFLAPIELAGPGAGGNSVTLQLSGPDVVSAEGLLATQTLVAAIEGSPLADRLVQGEQPPAVLSFMNPVLGAIASGQVPTELPTEGVKQVYGQALNSIPEAFRAVITDLLIGDPATATGQAGLIVLTFTEPITPEDQGLLGQVLGSVGLPDGFTLAPAGAPEPPDGPPTVEEIKTGYLAAREALPPEFTGFLSFLTSSDFDPGVPSASKGLVAATLTDDLTSEDLSSLATELSAIDIPSGYRLGFTGPDPTTNDLKQAFTDGLDFIPADQAGVVEQLLSSDRDLGAVTASNGLLIVFVEQPADEADFTLLTEEQSALADDIAALDLPDGITATAFSFELIFASGTDATSEIGRMFGLAFLIIVVILLFNFFVRISGAFGPARSVRRTAADTALTLVTILFAITWMQGLGVLLGPKYLGLIGDFNQIVQILPILLIGLGVDYGIHMTSRYREELAADGVDESIRHAIRTVGVALVLATATTVVGFLTNLVSPVPALADFGVLAAAGIIASFVLMLTFVPAIRLLLDRRAESKGRLPMDDISHAGERGGLIGPVMAGLIGGALVYVLSSIIEIGIAGSSFGEVFELASLLTFAAIGAVVGFVIIWLPRIVGPASKIAEKFAVIAVIIAVALAVVGEFGRQQLSTEFSFTDFVPSDNPLLGAFDLLTEEFAGGFGETTNVLVEGDVASVAAHNAQVDAFEALGTTPDVLTFAGEASAVSILSLLDSLIDPASPTFSPDVAALADSAGVGSDLRVPSGADVVGLYDALGQAAPDQFSTLMYSENGGGYEATLWTITTQAGDARVSELRENLDTAFAPVVVAAGSAIPTSTSVINDVVVQSLQDSQLQSLLITLAAATLLLVINFWFESRRPLLGVITMLPVGLVVLLTFGMMALTGIPFGPGADAFGDSFSTQMPTLRSWAN